MLGGALTRLLVGAVLAGVVSGCGTQPASSEADILEALAKSWRLVAGTSPDGPLTGLAETDVTLNGRAGLQGDTGCNAYSVGYELLARGGFRITDSATSTAVACNSPAAGELEAGYLAALDSADHVRLDGGLLVLEGDASRLVFASAGVPDVDPSGSWVLVSATGMNGELLPAAVSWVTFEAAGGTFKGVAACGGLWLDVTIAGSTVQPGDVGIDEVGCEPAEVWAVHQVVVDGMAQARGLSRDGDELAIVGERIELRFTAAG